MKNINIPLEDERHADLSFIQEYYGKKTGIKLSKAQTIKKLLFETSNLIRNTGETYPNRDWTFVNQEELMHQEEQNMNNYTQPSSRRFKTDINHL